MYVYIFFSSESLLYVKSKVGVGYIKEHMVYIFLFISSGDDKHFKLFHYLEIIY